MIGDAVSEIAKRLFGKSGGMLLDTQTLGAPEAKAEEHRRKVRERQGDSLHLQNEATKYLKRNKLPPYN